MSTPVSAHFGLSEFDCHDGTGYPPEWIAERLVPLCRVLERLRDELHAPITILSGYRTLAHNEALRDADGSGSGVAKDSQHVQGRAADIVAKGIAPAQVHATVLRLYAAGQLPDLGGVGLYQRWVHVDVRPRPADGHLARWSGPGVA